MGATVSSALEREPGAGLTKKDAERIKKRFKRLSDGSDLLSVHQFEMVPELAGNPFLPQLFALWDHDKDDKLTQEEFNAAIDTFLRAQTPEEKMQLAFRIFDSGGKGRIGEKDLTLILSKSSGAQMSESDLQTIVRSTIIEHDKDKDGYLNYQEFKALLSREDLNSNVLP